MFNLLSTWTRYTGLQLKDATLIPMSAQKSVLFTSSLPSFSASTSNTCSGSASGLIILQNKSGCHIATSPFLNAGLFMIYRSWFDFSVKSKLYPTHIHPFFNEIARILTENNLTIDLHFVIQISLRNNDTQEVFRTMSNIRPACHVELVFPLLSLNNINVLQKSSM